MPVPHIPPGLFLPGMNPGLQTPVTTSMSGMVSSYLLRGASWTLNQASAAVSSTVGGPGPGVGAGSWQGYTAGASASTVQPSVQSGVGVNPYLPPYLLPGASQQASVQIPYRCETDHQHLPHHSCTTAKRKLMIYDLEVHMRYASSTVVTIDGIYAKTGSGLHWIYQTYKILGGEVESVHSFSFDWL